MTLNYVGNRAHDTRLAEFSYTESEEKTFDLIVNELRACGYNVDDGVFGWAAIVVEDKKDFDLLKKYYQKIKKMIK